MLISTVILFLSRLFGCCEHRPVRRYTTLRIAATGNQTFTLSGARGKHLVIYFYPKDSTPGCTTEAQQFRDLYAEFQKADCEIVGISRDSIKSHENFKGQIHPAVRIAVGCR